MAELIHKGKLVHDLLCPNAAEMYFVVLKRRVDQFKNEEGRHVMCKAMGNADGMRETILATAKRLFANGKLMLKELAECSGLSLAHVKKLQASMA